MIRRALLALLLVAPLAGSCSKGRDTLTVGALYPMSGPQASAGQDELRGVRLAVERVNAAGGIAGKQVKLVTADAPTPESAAGALRSLVARKISVVFGTHSSAVSAAAAAATRKQPVTYFETGAVGQVAASGVNGTTFFRLAPMGANLGRAAIGFVTDQLDPGQPLHWAVANADDVYGSAVAGGAVAELQRRGVQVVGQFPYDANRFDPATVADRIAASGANALFVASYLDDGIALRRANLARGNKMVAEIGTSSSYCHPAFGAALGAQAVGLFASDKPDAADVNASALREGARAALAWVAPRYKDAYHGAMDAPALSGFSGALGVLQSILPKAASLSAPDVRAAALRVDLPEGSLPNGSGLAFAPAGAPDAGENRGASSVIWEWVAPGQRAVVWPPAFANAAIVR